MTEHQRVNAGQPDAAPSGNVPGMNAPRTRARWYTCVTDRVAEVPHLVERHAWHMIFSPDPFSIKLGLAFYANPESERAYRHRRRVVALACMLRRIEMGGRTGARAERRLHRWPFLVTEEQVHEARRLVDREVAAGKRGMDQSPRSFQGSPAFILPIIVFGFLFVQGSIVGAGPVVIPAGLGALLFILMNVSAWAWRQGYREASWQSMQFENVERAVEREDFDAQRKAEEAARVAAATPCSLDVHVTEAQAGEGYLYVLQFSTGMIKVGQSTRIRRRLAEHSRDAAPFGVVITKCWVSRPHRDFLETEVALIEACLIAKGRRVRQEYFAGVAFDVAVGFADQLAIRCRPASGVAR